MTIHCKSIAWVASLSTILLIRICPFKSILLSTNCSGSSPTGSQLT